MILALKPDAILRVLKEISGSVEDGTLNISVAASVRIATIEAMLPDTVSVIRAMPNTPALVGYGVTGISSGSRASLAAVT